MSTPAVGQTVVWDGIPHTITAVGDKTADFAVEGGDVRTVALSDIVPHEDAWGVLGRIAKRPARSGVGVASTPTAKEG